MCFYIRLSVWKKVYEGFDHTFFICHVYEGGYALIMAGRERYCMTSILLSNAPRKPYN